MTPSDSFFVLKAVTSLGITIITIIEKNINN